jgi:hypothetical protein
LHVLVGWQTVVQARGLNQVPQKYLQLVDSLSVEALWTQKAYKYALSRLIPGILARVNCLILAAVATARMAVPE